MVIQARSGPTRGALARRASHAVLAVVAALWIAFALHTLGAFGDLAQRLFDLWVYGGLLAIAAVACLVRAMTLPAERAAWTLMALGIAAWAGGETYWSLNDGGDALPVPSLADALYLSLYPLAYATLVLLVRRRTMLSRRVWLDGLIGASCAGAVALAVALPAFDVGDGNTAATIVNLAYPALDVVLLVFVVLVLGLSGWRPGRRWLLIGAGLALMAVADVAYLVEDAAGVYVEGGLLDAVWPASALLVALAAWQPAGALATPVETDRRLVAVPVLCGLVALGLVAAGVFGDLSAGASALALTTLLLVTARMGYAYVETQRMLAENRLYATTDGLTGLGNRRRLVADLQQAVDKATVERPWLCVLLDLDGFKAYNDAFGHPAGDEMLTRFGSALADLADRLGGRAYRLGGDEFCLLAQRGRADVDEVVARAREALTDSGEAFAVSSSAGTVLIPFDAQAPAAVLRLADRRMYADKGRRSSSAGHQSHAVLLRILREREPERHDHLVGAAELAMAVGRQLSMSTEELDELARAAELHDLGKIAIPEAILRKPGPLDEDEWAFVKRHTLIGERILSAAPALRPVARLVRSAHERYDGGGYPDGLAGDDIPLAARIVAVCDAYQAMTSDRPYRAALSPEQAVAELEANAGTQFDPLVVDVLVGVLAEEVATPVGGEPTPTGQVPRGARGAGAPRPTPTGQVPRGARGAGAPRSPT